MKFFSSSEPLFFYIIQFKINIYLFKEHQSDQHIVVPVSQLPPLPPLPEIKRCPNSDWFNSKTKNTLKVGEVMNHFTI